MVFPLCRRPRLADATGVFGSHLVGKGRITQHQLMETLELQQKSRIPLGRMAFQRGYLTIDQVVDVLERQTAEGGPFGEIAIAAGYLSPERRDELLAMNGGYRYGGYLEIIGRYLLRPKEAPIHPSHG